MSGELPIADEAERAEGSAVLEARGVHKRFGPVVALDNVSFNVRGGEIVALLGENGAGKTTLLNILCGMGRPDRGTLLIDGRAVVLRSPDDALRHGICTVYQHFALVPELTVVENAALGLKGGVLLDVGAAARRLSGVLDRLGVRIPLNARVRDLSLGQRQWIEIAKAMLRDARVLLLDEPTSVLTPDEVGELFDGLRRLRAAGVSVVLITHKLNEALELSNRIVVLRRGRQVADIGPGTIDRVGRATVHQAVVDAMFGEAEATSRSDEFGAFGRLVRTAHSRPVLSIRDLSARGERGEPVLTAIDLDLHAGEIVGIAGVDGNGQRELAEVITGQLLPSRGTILVDGVDITGRGIAAAHQAGVGHVSEDRLGEGSVAVGTIAENLALKRISQSAFGGGGRFLLNRRAMASRARDVIAHYDVRAADPSTPIGRLSGGNIQRVLLARELEAGSRVLICNKPTHGLDQRTARTILTMLRERANAGGAVLLISSELDDLLAVSDRIGVMLGGRMVAMVDRAEADPRSIGVLMLGNRPARVVGADE